MARVMTRPFLRERDRRRRLGAHVPHAVFPAMHACILQWRYKTEETSLVKEKASKVITWPAPSAAIEKVVSSGATQLKRNI